MVEVVIFFSVIFIWKCIGIWGHARANGEEGKRERGRKREIMWFNDDGGDVDDDMDGDDEGSDMTYGFDENEEK